MKIMLRAPSAPAEKMVELLMKIEEHRHEEMMAALRQLSHGRSAPTRNGRNER